MSRKSDLKDKNLKETIESDPLVSVPIHPHYISLTSEHKESDLKGVKLEGKDWIALFIALIQTVFFPFLILMVVLLILAYVFQALF